MSSESSNRSSRWSTPADDSMLNTSSTRGHGRWTSESEFERESELDGNHKPEILIRFEELSNKRVHMKVETKTLERVEQFAKNLPLCVLNIAGPKNLGKSFLLNAILQKLETRVKTGKKDSLCTRIPIRFPCKNDGNSQGIIIWPQPFIINDNGEKLAVLVTETNGLHDSGYDSNEALTSIYCLSFLISSNFIYNTSEEGITEDAFMPWLPFAEFGQLLEETANSTGDEPKPFQTLSFVIRDWKNVTEDFHGPKDRMDFLLKRLKQSMSNVKLSRLANDFQTAITEYFSVAECCVLPPPGVAARSIDFDGSLSDLDPDFVNQLNKYVNNLLSFKYLKPKCIGNTKINLGTFTHLLSAYVGILNSYNDTGTMNGQLIKQITDQTLIECTTDQAKEKYDKMLENGVHLDDVDFQALHNKAKKKAFAFLFKTLPPTPPTDYNNHKTQLEIKITESYVEFSKQNKEQRNTEISKKINMILALYRQALEKTLVFKNKFDFYEESFIEETSAEIILGLEPHLTASFSNETKDVLQHIRQILENETDIMLKTKLKACHENCRNAEEYILNKIEPILNRHQAYLEKHVAKTGPALNLLASVHEMLVESTLAEFRKESLPGPIKFQQHVHGQLEERLEEIYNDIMNREEHKQRFNEEKAIKLAQFMLQDYEKMFSSAIESCTSERQMKDHHHAIAEHLISKLQTECPLSLESIQGSKFLQKFKSELKSLYKSMVNCHLQNLELSENYQTAINHALALYTSQMENVIELGWVTDEKLQTAHSKHSWSCIQMMEVKGDDATAASHYTTDLENCILEEFTKIKAKNRKLYQIESETQKMLDEMQNKFLDQMITFKNPEEMNQAHSLHLQKCTSALKEKLGEQSSKTMYDVFLDKCKKFFQQMKSMNAVTFDVLSEKERLLFSKLLMEVRYTYHENMSKFVKGKNFHSSSAIDDIHKEVLNSIISTCGYQITPEQRQEVFKMMEDSVTKYRIEYAMSRSNQIETPAIGIDLGTTYCCVAVIQNEPKPKIIPSLEGTSTTASYVTFNSDGSFEAGQTAKTGAYLKPEYTVFDAKRLIGRRFQDSNVQNDMTFWPFVVSDHDGTPMIDIYDTAIHPEHVLAALFANLKLQAEFYLRTSITKAVITVPVYFNDGQRAATKDAAEIAGFEVLTILNEPTAAAIAYKVEHFSDVPKNVLVYDLGGGTFDVAVLQTAAKSIRVLAVDGDTHLGGEDFDKALMEECVRLLKRKTGIDLLVNKDSNIKHERDIAKRALRRLQTSCEEAKCTLSNALQATINVDNIINSHDFNEKISRSRFEELNMEYFRKTVTIVQKALKAANVEKESLHDILLVGGSTRIPKIREMLAELFNKNLLRQSVQADAAVAYGAAVQAALLNGVNEETLLSLETINDVTPMALGISTNCATNAEGYFVIIHKNTPIPHSATKLYNISVKTENSMSFYIYQGDNAVASKNDLLGTLELTDINSYVSGKEKIEVEMEIDRMGILSIKALCKRTNEKKSIC
ncbi:Heat shock 70 kDa protein cognate 4 [Orchesella cincta]|uniref:Heat shock 70 kDa protein cognate 4 n=1 Tax=Orchesella cincta TaxID=48709 RepID=A0A1D2MPA7_ORCCI|nr:Heat shock 70 kDa protein cognate 4 [Orchesella cincta]